MVEIDWSQWQEQATPSANSQFIISAPNRERVELEEAMAENSGKQVVGC